MTIQEAIKALVDGKKIRQKTWSEGVFIYFTENKLRDEKGRGFYSLCMELEDNWEIYGEKQKTKTVYEWMYRYETISAWNIENSLWTEEEASHYLDNFIYQKTGRSWEVPND